MNPPQPTNPSSSTGRSSSAVDSSSPIARPSSSVDDRPSSNDHAIAFFLALLLFGAYLLPFNGSITSSDGLSMFAVTESFMKRGDLTTDQWWTFFRPKSLPAPDGEVYSKYGYGTSLFGLPLYALAWLVPLLGLMKTTLLSVAIATCGTAYLLYLAARRLKFSQLTGVTIVLLFGLASPAWLYAKEFWSEAFAALTLFAAFYFLLRYRVSLQMRDVVVAGVWLGLAIAVRTTNILLVPFYLAYAFVVLTPRNDKRPSLQIQWLALVLFLIPISLFLLSVLLYNDLRYQNPFTTGYRADEKFNNNIFLGAYGLLFSPGKGLFVYAPFLVALPFGIWQFYREHKRELLLALSIFLFTLLLFSAWYYWSGGTNWAARFLVPTLPFLALLCAPLVKLLLEPRTGFAFYLLRFIFAFLVLISFVNEVAGVSLNSVTYRFRVVGIDPNPDWNAIFQPALSPLIGYWQTIKPTNFDVTWLRATSDTIQVDWLVIALIVALIAFSVWMVVQLLRGHSVTRGLVFGALAAVIALTLFALARSAEDPKVARNAGYTALLQTVAARSNADDVMILSDEAQARYFFNENRSRLKWYSLSRDPARWDVLTQALVHRLTQQHPRLWVAYDNAMDKPNPMRDWLEENLRATQQFDFENGVTLVLYQR